MSGENVGALTVFRTTIEVMLRDGILTREEKRLIIKLANALGLSPDEPAEIYAAIREQRETEAGREVTPNEQRLVYTRVFEVAIVNASLSKEDFEKVINLIGEKRIDPSQLISRRVGLNEFPTAFQALKKPGSDLKVMMKPSKKCVTA